MFGARSRSVVRRQEANEEPTTASQRRLRRLLSVAADQSERVAYFNHAENDHELVRGGGGSALFHFTPTNIRRQSTYAVGRSGRSLSPTARFAKGV